MNRQKIVAGAVSLVSIFTLNSVKASAVDYQKPELVTVDSNLVTVKNGFFVKEDNFVLVKDLSGKITNFIPANFSVEKDGTLDKVSAQVSANRLNIVNLGKIGKLTTADAKSIVESIKKPKKNKKKRIAKPNSRRKVPVMPPGNAADLIPSYINLLQVAFANGDVPTLGLGAAGSLLGVLLGTPGAMLGSTFNVVGAGLILSLGGLIGLPLEFIGAGVDAFGFAVLAAVLAALIGVGLTAHGGKNVSGNPKVKRAAVRLSNNLKAVLPSYNILGE